MTKPWLPYDEYMKTINPNWIPREQYLKQQQAKREQYIEALKKISMHYDSYLTLAKYADGCTQKYDKNMELGEPKPLLVIDAVTEKEHWNYTDGPRFPTTCVHGHAYVGDVQNRVFKAGYGYDNNNVFQKPDPAKTERVLYFKALNDARYAEQRRKLLEGTIVNSHKGNIVRSPRDEALHGRYLKRPYWGIAIPQYEETPAPQQRKRDIQWKTCNLIGWKVAPDHKKAKDETRFHTDFEDWSFNNEYQTIVEGHDIILDKGQLVSIPNEGTIERKPRNKGTFGDGKGLDAETRTRHELAYIFSDET